MTRVAYCDLSQTAHHDPGGPRYLTHLRISTRLDFIFPPMSNLRQHTGSNHLRSGHVAGLYVGAIGGEIDTKTFEYGTRWSRLNPSIGERLKKEMCVALPGPRDSFNSISESRACEHPQKKERLRLGSKVGEGKGGKTPAMCCRLRAHERNSRITARAMKGYDDVQKHPQCC